MFRGVYGRYFWEAPSFEHRTPWSAVREGLIIYPDVKRIDIIVKEGPFPFAAIAIAAYTGKAELNFDEDSTDVSLETDGTRVTDDAEIVQSLAKAGGLAEDSVKETGNIKAFGLLKNNGHPHISRWFSHLESLESIQTALAAFTSAKASKARSNKTAAGFALGLHGAKEGEVVTRFPPEPSGYLHIGHAKAAILNQYFAKMYKGKMLIRFDDTNPSKERTEFEETILEDLMLLDVHGDGVSHTSDYFEKLYELGLQIIKIGKGYADDTEQAQMRDERMNGVASKHRDDSVEENLKHFEEMTKGTPEAFDGVFGPKLALITQIRPCAIQLFTDAILFLTTERGNYFRLSDKWKVYPTYDFACPIVDSVEGVTHALRTNEYRDRNAQYQWMIEALSLRPVYTLMLKERHALTEPSSRLNFVYTLLSKRKLHWFVDNKLVRGWDDPRFPTVRGILGMF
ncbi:glutamate-tRNA ligase [Salix suchowensis]|nr:glutamate-tRNA ligase [Salix suchowensis]